jgi:hypothetical protein
MVMIFVFTPLVGPVDAAKYNTHIDLNNYSCHQDENIKITAQLWEEGKIFNLRLGGENLNFYIYDTHQRSVLMQETSKTKWNGLGTIILDTHCLTPGNYSIIVDYNGNGYDYFGYYYYDVSSTKTRKLIVLP